ncbi:MAG: hypothetical protein GX601_15310 [Anaerolineales bacterium]|nr:hypothetical protein [Anaerolineales bacterium]
MQLYLIRDVTTSYLTFGFCQDVEAELTAHQAARAHPLELLYAFEVHYPELLLLVWDLGFLRRLALGSYKDGAWYALPADEEQTLVEYFDVLSTVLTPVKLSWPPSPFRRALARL